MEHTGASFTQPEHGFATSLVSAACPREVELDSLWGRGGGGRQPRPSRQRVKMIG